MNRDNSDSESSTHSGESFVVIPDQHTREPTAPLSPQTFNIAFQASIHKPNAQYKDGTVDAPDHCEGHPSAAVMASKGKAFGSYRDQESYGSDDSDNDQLDDEPDPDMNLIRRKQEDLVLASLKDSLLSREQKLQFRRCLQENERINQAYLAVDLRKLMQDKSPEALELRMLYLGFALEQKVIHIKNDDLKLLRKRHTEVEAILDSYKEYQLRIEANRTKYATKEHTTTPSDGSGSLFLSQERKKGGRQKLTAEDIEKAVAAHQENEMRKVFDEIDMDTDLSKGKKKSLLSKKNEELELQMRFKKIRLTYLNDLGRRITKRENLELCLNQIQWVLKNATLKLKPEIIDDLVDQQERTKTTLKYLKENPDEGDSLADIEGLDHVVCDTFVSEQDQRDDDTIRMLQLAKEMAETKQELAEADNPPNSREKNTSRNENEDMSRFQDALIQDDWKIKSPPANEYQQTEKDYLRTADDETSTSRDNWNVSDTATPSMLGFGRGLARLSAQRDSLPGVHDSAHQDAASRKYKDNPASDSRPVNTQHESRDKPDASSHQQIHVAQDATTALAFLRENQATRGLLDPMIQPDTSDQRVLRDAHVALDATELALLRENHATPGLLDPMIQPRTSDQKVLRDAQLDTSSNQRPIPGQARRLSDRAGPSSLDGAADQRGRRAKDHVPADRRVPSSPASLPPSLQQNQQFEDAEGAKLTTQAGRGVASSMEAGTSTVIVRGVEGLSQDVVELFFESKKKSGGGDINDMIIDGNDATIEFEDPEAAARVLSKGTLTIGGKSLTMEEPPKPTQVDPCSILVKDIGSMSRDVLELFFESKKKSGGGDLKALNLDAANQEAIITFEEEEVAQRVLERASDKALIIDNCELSIFPRIINLASQPDVLVPEPTDPRVVIVEGFGHSTSKEVLQMLCESKRGGNGDVIEIDFDKENGEAKVTFEDPLAAERMINIRTLTLDGAELTVRAPTPRLVPRAPSNLAIPGPQSMAKKSGASGSAKSQNYGTEELQGVTTVLVKYRGSSEKDVRIVLENKRESGGGEVQYIDLYPEMSVALVKFKNGRDAQSVLERGSVVIGGDQCVVDPADTSLEDIGRYPGALAISVSQIPPDTDTELIELFFTNRRKSGGGDISDIYWVPEKGKAVITYVSPDTVEGVVSKHNKSILKLNKGELRISKMVPGILPKLVLGPKEPKKLFIVNAPSVTPKDLKKYFSSGLDKTQLLKEVLYSLAEKKAILLEFDSMPDYEDLQLLCATRPLKDHMLTIQRVALPTRIQVHDIGANEEMIELYFQDPKNGGDMDVIVEEMDDQMHWAVLDCPSSAVVKNLTQRRHSIRGKNVHVSIFYPEFGIIPSTCDPRKPWDFMPAPYVHPYGDPQLSDFIYKFIKTCQGASALIQDVAKNSGLFEIAWDKIDKNGLLVKCVPTFKPKPKGKPWEQQCRHAVDQILSTIAVSKVSTLTGSLDTIVTEAKKLMQGQEVHVDVDRAQSVIFITGWEPDVKPIVAKLDEVNKALERDQKSVEETVKAKSYQCILIRALKYQDKLQQSYPNLIVRFNKATEIVLKGLPDEVKSAKLAIYEDVLNRMVSDKIPLQQRVAAFLRSKLVKDHMIQIFQARKMTVVMEIASADVTLFALSKDEVKKASVIIKDSIKEYTLRLQPENVPVLQTDVWDRTKTLHLEKFNGLFEMDEDIASKEINIICVQTVHDELVEDLKNCLDENSILEQFITLEKGHLRLIEKAFRKEVDDIEKKFQHSMIKCNPVVGQLKCGYSVKGSKHGIPQVVQGISDIASSILSDDYSVGRPGMPKYFHSVKGKEYLESLEYKHNIACEVLNPRAPSQRGPDQEVQGPSSGIQEVHSVVLEGGFTVRVVQADITKLRVGAIVNAANSELEHYGGLAAAIVKEGGNEIQQECRTHVKRKGQVYPGNVFVGKRTGRLPCDVIIHAVGPVYDPRIRDKTQVNELYEAAFACLEEADKQELRDIAIPALSTGIFNFPLKEATKTICEAVLDVYFTNPAVLKEVCLVDTLSPTVNSFKQSLLELLKEKGVQCQSTSPDVVVTTGSGRNRNRRIKTPEATERKVTDPEGAYGGEAVAQSFEEETSRPSFWQRGPKPNTLISREGMMVQLKKANLVKEQVDAIVNTTNPTLDLGQGAVSTSILKAAGPELQAECREFAPVGVQFAEVVRTSAGSMKNAKSVLHGACEAWDGGKGRSQKILKQFIHNCLKTADDNKFTSIAFPAVGTGNLQFPRPLVCQYMFEELLSFSEKFPQSTVKDVRIILYDKDVLTVQAFETHVGNLAKTAEPATQQGPSVRSKDRALKTPNQPAGRDSNTRAAVRQKRPMYQEDPESDDKTLRVGDVQVQIVEGDITEERTEAIVNSTNNILDFNIGAVSAAILKKGGKSIKTECHKILSANRGRINRHAMTAAGKLKCKHIVHMDAQKGTNWEEIIHDTLVYADKNKVASLAIPAIGTGGLGHKPEEMAEIMLKAIANFAKDEPQFLSHIRIVIFDKKVFKAFKSQTSKVLKGQGLGILGNLMGVFSNMFGFNKNNEDEGFETISSASSPSTSTDLSSVDLSTLTIRIYATNSESIENIKKRLEELCDEETTRIVLDKPDEQELISKLSSEQVAQILSLENKYQIRVDVEQKSRLHRIRLEGNAKDVASCSAEVTRILHSVQREKQAEQHAKQITEFVKWEYKADGHFTPYPDAITVIIEKAHSSKQPQAEWEEEEGVYRIIFADMVEKAYGKHGRGPAKTTIPVRRKLLTAGDEDGGLPENWEDMKKGEPFTLVQLNPIDLEYTDVECTFRKTSQTLNSIVKIERVQNPSLYQQYSVKKKHMEAANPSGHQNERTLYHGTSADTLKSINTTGFNRSYCGKNAVVIGKGVYFARDAMYSSQNTYSPPDANGHKHVYQSKVLTGEFTRGSSGLLAPPPKDPNVPHILFDSVVDLPANPSIYVIFNDTLAYPEYLITFT